MHFRHHLKCQEKALDLALASHHYTSVVQAADGAVAVAYLHFETKPDTVQTSVADRIAPHLVGSIVLKPTLT